MFGVVFLRVWFAFAIARIIYYNNLNYGRAIKPQKRCS